MEQEKVIKEDYLKIDDTHYLYHRLLNPKSDKKADVLIVHGFAEHSGRYNELVDTLIKEGFGVLIFDLRGHGRSSGRRGDIVSFEDYLNDIHSIRKIIKDSSKPLFILGHSLGGLLVLLYAQRYQKGLSGVIACSPYLRLAFQPPTIKVLLARMIVRFLPHLQMGNEIDATMLSHDPEKVKAYQEDPLVHHVVTPRWFLGSLHYQKRVFDEVGEIKIPVLLLHGKGDGITAWSATMEFFEKLITKDKQIKLFENLYHELFQEKERYNVMNEVVSWLNAHL